jgi:hypothetical protein
MLQEMQSRFVFAANRELQLGSNSGIGKLHRKKGEPNSSAPQV